MQDGWSSVKLVEALFAAGVDNLFLETLPEAILAPLQEAIVECQSEPPTTWSQELLALVGREDVSMLLTSGRPFRGFQPPLLVSTRFPFHSEELNIDSHHHMNQVWMSMPSAHPQQRLRLLAHLMGLPK